jgi:hypothetical protein
MTEMGNTSKEEGGENENTNKNKEKTINLSASETIERNALLKHLTESGELDR